MTRSNLAAPNPELDLVFERIVDVPVERVWRAWTTPEHILKWFTPSPWVTTECDMDLRPGGRFRTVMRSPEGQSFPNEGCFLEIVPNERLVWTNALASGFRPSVLPTDGSCDSFAFTAVIALAPSGTGTRYTATVIHGDPVSRKKHEDMGFHEGWGKALDQLVALARTM